MSTWVADQTAFFAPLWPLIVRAAGRTRV